VTAKHPHCDSRAGCIDDTTFGVPLPQDVDGRVDDNDPIGVVSTGYTAATDFGLGSHHDLSAQNVFEDRSGDQDTGGDFNLRYHVVGRIFAMLS
jgi:hypothetical protein